MFLLFTSGIGDGVNSSGLRYIGKTTSAIAEFRSNPITLSSLYLVEVIGVQNERERKLTGKLLVY